MEDNKHFYESEYKEANHRAASLERQLVKKEEEVKKQVTTISSGYKESSENSQRRSSI